MFRIVLTKTNLIIFVNVLLHILHYSKTCIYLYKYAYLTLPNAWLLLNPVNQFPSKLEFCLVRQSTGEKKNFTIYVKNSQGIQNAIITMC